MEAIFWKTIRDLDNNGYRNPLSGNLGNFEHLLWEVSDGHVGHFYYECKTQAEEVKAHEIVSEARKPFDDKWKLNIVPAWHRGHYWLEALSDNSTDPVVKMDPFKGKIKLISRP